MFKHIVLSLIPLFALSAAPAQALSTFDTVRIGGSESTPPPGTRLVVSITVDRSLLQDGKTPATPDALALRKSWLNQVTQRLLRQTSAAWVPAVFVSDPASTWGYVRSPIVTMERFFQLLLDSQALPAAWFPQSDRPDQVVAIAQHFRAQLTELKGVLAAKKPSDDVIDLINRLDEVGELLRSTSVGQVPLTAIEQVKLDPLYFVDFDRTATLASDLEKAVNLLRKAGI